LHPRGASFFSNRSFQTVLFKPFFSNRRSCITICSKRRNAGTCAPSRMTLPKRPWFWIAKLIKRKAATRRGHGSDVHYAGGRRTKRTSGLATAATCGIRSTPEECARRVSTSGPRPNAPHASDGPRIPSGMANDRVRTPLGLLPHHAKSSRPERLVVVARDATTP